MKTITKRHFYFIVIVTILYVLLAVWQVNAVILLEHNETFNYTYNNETEWQDFFCEELNLNQTITVNLKPGETSITIYEDNGIEILGSCTVEDEIDNNICSVTRVLGVNEKYERDSGVCDISFSCEDSETVCENKIDNVVHNIRVEIFEDENGFIRTQIDGQLISIVQKHNNTVNVDLDKSFVCPTVVEIEDFETDQITDLCRDYSPYLFDWLDASLKGGDVTNEELDNLRLDREDALRQLNNDRSEYEKEISSLRTEVNITGTRHSVCLEELSIAEGGKTGWKIGTIGVSVFAVIEFIALIVFGVLLGKKGNMRLDE